MKYLRIILFSSFIFGLGCSDNAKPIDKENVSSDSKPYFDFDEVEHYQIDSSEEDASKLYDSKKGFD